MGVVTLKKSGLIYQDKFDATALDGSWELIPHDPASYELTGGGLRLKSEAAPLFLFFPQLTAENEFVFDLKNEYTPSISGDRGGLTIFGRDADRLDMEEYCDESEGGTKTYPWIRMIRSYYAYSALWSDTGTLWNFEGAEQFDITAPKVGVFLTGMVDMLVQEVRIFRSTKVKITGLVEGSQVDLWQGSTIVSSGICRKGLSELDLDVSGISLPFTGNFVVRLPENNVFSSVENLEIWGGDEYHFEPNADLYLVDDAGEEVPLMENMERFLGYVQSMGQDYKDFRILIRNNMASGTIKNIKINLTWPKGTTADLKLADLYRDINGQPAVKYAVLDYPTIAAGTATPFWLRIYRITDAMASSGISDVQFGINMVSNYIK
ncbi:hypothetical protein [Paenibacillus sp. FSL P2-0136]|uniref:hypothetical protein n=1 Tax=Paenibacillus sp. FSL P2-0136 TaxID=2975317 RepID=UPI0030D9F0BA